MVTAAQAKIPGKAAAFYDVDGTLLRTNVIHAYAYYAVNLPTLAGKLGRAIRLAASLPLYGVAEAINRKLFNDIFYKNYEGISKDRLWVLGEELFDRVLKPSLFRGAADLIRRSKQDGVRQVLVTGALDFVTEPLARYLDVDEWVANKLEFRDDYATGHILKPVLAGGEKALWVRRWAEKGGYDLDASFAYADSHSDYPMLSVVGNPVATNPDFKLKAAARAADWPVLVLE